MAESRPRSSGSGSPGSDAGIYPELTAAGLTLGDISLLGAIADMQGYGLSPGTPMSEAQAQDFALIMLSNCDAVASGYTTWSSLAADDVLSGAPPSAARRMYAHVRSNFCP